MPNLKKRISWHLTDLLGKDVSVSKDVAEWLTFSPSDISQRRVNKRLMARYAAAKMILAAVEEGNSGLFTHILDRTEGKVAQELITLDGNRLIEQLEAGRQRVLAAYNQDTVDGEVVSAQLDTEHALDQQSSVDGRVQVARPPQGEAPGPIGGVESHGISPLESETGK